MIIFKKVFVNEIINNQFFHIRFIFYIGTTSYSRLLIRKYNIIFYCSKKNIKLYIAM